MGIFSFSRGCIDPPPNLTKGVSCPIFILSNTEMNKMLIELPLSIRILWTLKLVIVADTTKASLWRRCKPFIYLYYESDGRAYFGHGRREIVYFFICLPLYLLSMPLSEWSWTSSQSETSMDGLDVSSSRFVVSILSLKCGQSWTIDHELPQVSPLDHISYIFFQLKKSFVLWTWSLWNSQYLFLFI